MLVFTTQHEYKIQLAGNTSLRQDVSCLFFECGVGEGPLLRAVMWTGLCPEHESKALDVQTELYSQQRDLSTKYRGNVLVGSQYPVYKEWFS